MLLTHPRQPEMWFGAAHMVLGDASPLFFQHPPWTVWNGTPTLGNFFIPFFAWHIFMVLVWLLCHAHDPQVTSTLGRFYWLQTSSPWMGVNLHAGREEKAPQISHVHGSVWHPLLTWYQPRTVVWGCVHSWISTRCLREDFRRLGLSL